MHLLLTPVAELDWSALPQQLVVGILTGSIYALIALGYTMVYGILKLINFAHGEVFMLGAYIGLFISWIAISDLAARAGATAIISPDNLTVTAYVLVAVGALATIALYAWARRKRQKTNKLFIGVGLMAMGGLVWLLATYQPQAITLVVMLLASMTGCAIIGVLIEFFAYRPMRNQPRISILITAIGVSLLIQFTGQLFLPNAPPPKIAGDVNPYRGSVSFFLKAPPQSIAVDFKIAEEELDEALAAKQVVVDKVGGNEFDLPPDTPELLRAREAESAFNKITALQRDNSVSITVPTGQLIMFLTAIVLMFILRHLVMKTKMGRGMRAVSHDFEAASLMGVSVNKVIVVTFIIGSALAGAGAMMSATFLATPLTSFYGLVPGVKAFVAAVLGGIGNIPGAVLGGLLMGLAEVMMIWIGYSGLKDAMAFVILILVLMFRPGGLLGSAAIEKV